MARHTRLILGYRRTDKMEFSASIARQGSNPPVTLLGLGGSLTLQMLLLLLLLLGEQQWLKSNAALMQEVLSLDELKLLDELLLLERELLLESNGGRGTGGGRLAVPVVHVQLLVTVSGFLGHFGGVLLLLLYEMRLLDEIHLKLLLDLLHELLELLLGRVKVLG